MKLFNIFIFALFFTLANASFIQESKNIIKDTKANFLWQDSIDVKTNIFTYKEASTYCKNLKLDGKNNWKVPGFLELFSLVNTKSYNPTAFKEFSNIKADNYWTSKVFSHSASDEAFVIDFKSGAFNRKNQSDKFYIRCYKNLNK